MGQKKPSQLEDGLLYAKRKHAVETSERKARALHGLLFDVLVDSEEKTAQGGFFFPGESLKHEFFQSSDILFSFLAAPFAIRSNPDMLGSAVLWIRVAYDVFFQGQTVHNTGAGGLGHAKDAFQFLKGAGISRMIMQSEKHPDLDHGESLSAQLVIGLPFNSIIEQLDELAAGGIINHGSPPFLLRDLS